MNAWSTELGRLQTEATRWGSATSLLLRAAEPAGQRPPSVAQYMAATGKTAYFKDHLEELATIKSGGGHASSPTSG